MNLLEAELSAYPSSDSSLYAALATVQQRWDCVRCGSWRTPKPQVEEIWVGLCRFARTVPHYAFMSDRRLHP